MLKTRAGDTIGTGASEVYLTAAQVRARYGGVSDMTIHRWLRDPDLGFPRPEYLRKRRYWRAADLDTWDAQRQQQQAA